MSEAHYQYIEDLDPQKAQNAPRPFWPFCHAYKVAIHWAGEQLVADGEPLLAEIPDSDFVTLSTIELAAAMAGLPQHYGVRIGR